MKKTLTWLMVLAIFAGLLCGAARAADSPKEVYGKYVQACRTGKSEEFLKFVTAEKKKQFLAFKQETQDQICSAMKMSAPTEFKVTSKKTDRNVTKLTVEGIQFNKPSIGIIYMLYEEGKWLIQKQNWKLKQ